MRKKVSGPLLALVATVLVSSPILAYLYRAPLVILEADGNAYDMLPAIVDADNQWMADNGFMTATARDTAVTTLGGLARSHMVVDDKTLTASAVPANSQTNLYFSTGNTAADFDILAGYGGYIIIPGDTDLELGNNFEIEITDTFVDTSVGANKNIVKKDISFSLYTGVINGQITASIDSTGWTSPTGFVDPAVAWSNETNAYDNNLVTFTNTTATVAGTTWSEFLELTHVAINCNSVRVYLEQSADFNPVDIDVYYGGGWVHVFEGPFVDGVWIEHSLGGTYSLTAMRLRAFNTKGWGVTWKFDEVDFGELSSLASVTAVNQASDEHDILVTADGANLTISIDGAVAGDGYDTVALGGASCPVNDNDWILMDNITTQFMPYMGIYLHTVGGTLIAHYAPVAIIINTGEAGTADAGTQTTLDDAILDQADDYWNGARLIIVTTTDTFAPQGETSVITDFDDANDRLTFDTLTAVVDAGDTYTIDFGTLPDREGAAEDARITWGVNPDGVSASLGSMVSSSQPEPGATPVEPTSDILPETGADWYVEPDVGGTLLTNPLRPFVTILSDNTTMSEIQAWRLLGIAFVLSVTVLVARILRGHLLIAGIAGGVSVGACCALTIFPLYALIFMVIFVMAGVVAERSPSL